jgi:Uma2 family endonuclease
MATSVIVPVEEYLRTAYEPDTEYVLGHLVERHVGEWDHSLLQALITGLLLQRRRPRRFHVLTEQRVRVSDDPRYRIPDVCVVSVAHHREHVLTKPPHLAIEILSREDEPAEMLAKVGEYLNMGIPHVWVVDPYKRKVVEADRQGIRESSSRVVETDLVGVVDFNELFAQLDDAAQSDD